ncbi:MAG TPA: nitrilase-related carbon-nitrogen hydrolase [Patescibacteria group bacterium]|nr:nitrilase-related carbon-nitrogen hydrolase [Patescibacteria group bacterium]
MNRKKLTLKIASASCNQTGGDWPRNLANILAAIDGAAADRADILALEELGLSGYERGDDFYYTDNARTQELLQLIADYALAVAPNLIVSVGHPWYFADKELRSQPDRRKNPLFNRVNQQFDCQAFLANGRIVAISGKSYLFNYERGYEKRHFEEWSDAAANAYENEHGKGREGTIFIELPRIKIPVAFGSPVVQAAGDGAAINLWHSICEMYWVGSRFDGAKDNGDYDRDNPLAQKSRQFDVTVCLNPNASPPAANKYSKHIELCQLASQYCGVLVHTDGLGSSGSTFAQFGSRLIAQEGKIISEGKRLSFADMAYTSQLVEINAAEDKGHAPHAMISHEFSGQHSAPVQDGPAGWERGPRADMEEELRNELLWLFDYMRKNKISGIAQALSGGADSAYNAAKVRFMVELAVAELSVDGFLAAMPYLSYRDAVRAAARDGNEAAIDTIMSHMLTCVYMGTDNSSDDTFRAAKCLVEGGRTPEGETCKGIGGRFEYRNVQRLVEVYAEIFSGVNPREMDDAREGELRRALADILRTRKDDTSPQLLDASIAQLKSTFGEISGQVLSTANDIHSLAYENIQARLRQVLIMLFANVEGKIAIANPNLDEGRNSYATWGGDLHGGMISGNAHKGKQRQLDHMKLLFEFGLQGGVAPARSLYWVLKNRPSAELQPKSKDGKVTQFDEDQLGRSFRQMAVISYYMLNERSVDQAERKNSPIEVFEKLRRLDEFKDDDLETLHDRIRLSYDKWAHAQFKIHGSPIAATYGANIDKQTSLRTPNISAFHKPELAELAIYVLDKMAARDGVSLEKIAALPLAELAHRAWLDADFAAALTQAMWTPAATDGSKLKISTLYARVKSNGIGDMLTDSEYSRRLAIARKK